MSSAMLRPSLLDHLIDDSPADAPLRPRIDERRGYATLADLKRAIVRDIGRLLNANSLDQTVDLRAYPHVANSTLNFGAPALDGKGREGLDLYDIQENIAQSLRRFEPRLLPQSVHVTSFDDNGQGGAIRLRIEAELRAEPVPLRIVMRTEIDPESPVIRVVEYRDESGR